MICLKGDHKHLLGKLEAQEEMHDAEISYCSALLVEGEQLRAEIRWRDNLLKFVLNEYVDDEHMETLADEIQSHEDVCRVDIDGETGVTILKRVKDGPWKIVGEKTHAEDYKGVMS